MGNEGSEKPLVRLAIYDVEDKPPMPERIALGIQHVLAMFIGNITPPIIIASMVGLPAEDKIYLIQVAIFIAGVVSLIQAYPIGPIGARLPIIMGTSFGFLPTIISIIKVYGLSAVFGSAFVGGFFEGGLGLLLRKINIRKYFPPLVTGTVVLLIGLSLAPVGIDYAAGGVKAPDYGSLTNWGLALLVLVITVIFNVFGKGFLRVSSILIGVVVGYIVALAIGKVDLSHVYTASWVELPVPLRYPMTFPIGAIIAMLFMYVVTTIETIGDTTGVVHATGREPTERELSGSIIADGLGSSLAAVFGAFPNTSYSQNVGLVNLTGVVSRHVGGVAAIVLIILGLFPKLAAIVATIPHAVLGGATIAMFGMIASAGISIISREKMTRRNLLILALAIGIGLGLQLRPDALKYLPDVLRVFLSSGIVSGGLLAFVLNLVLPREEE